MAWLKTAIDALLAHVERLAKWLALPIVLMLFAQWPLREVAKAGSREANDLGQILFALFVAVSVTAATRAGSHLAAENIARSYKPVTRRWIAGLGAALAVLPWSIFVLWSATPAILRAMSQLERFGDTGNQGYFVIRMSLWLLCGAMVLAALIDICGGRARRTTNEDRTP